MIDNIGKTCAAKARLGWRFDFGIDPVHGQTMDDIAGGVVDAPLNHSG